MFQGSFDAHDTMEKLVSIATYIMSHSGLSARSSLIASAIVTETNAKMVLISSSFPEHKISRQLSNQLILMQESKKTSYAILRCLIKGLISDQQVFANSNANIILKQYPIIDTACRGKFLYSKMKIIR